jgi:hypothetical protein
MARHMAALDTPPAKTMAQRKRSMMRSTELSLCLRSSFFLRCGHGLTIHGDCHSLLAPADVAPFVDTMVLPVACGRSKPSPAWHRSVGQACVWPIRPAQLGIPAGHTGCYACRSQHSQHHPRMYGTSHSSFAATTATFRLRDKQAFQSADCRSRMPCVRTLARRG